MAEIMRARGRADETVKTVRVEARPPPVWLTAGIASGLALSGLELLAPVHFQNLAVRSAIEATVTLFALTGLGLLFKRFVQTRRRRDLAPLVAVGAASVVDLTLFAFPTLMGIRALQISPQARLLGLLLACA